MTSLFSTLLNKNGENEYFCLVLDITGKIFNLSLSMMLVQDFLEHAFYEAEEILYS
jgi:hypothetical protein